MKYFAKQMALITDLKRQKQSSGAINELNLLKSTFTCFSMTISKFSRAAFLLNTSGWMLL